MSNASRSRLLKWLIAAGCGAGVIGAALFTALYSFSPKLHRMAQQRFEAYLQFQFQSTVEFSDFHVRLFPRVQLMIDGVVMRHLGRTDIPALIEIRRMTIVARPEAFWARHEISRVRLEGLVIHTPPRVPGGTPIISGTHTDLASKYPFVIDEIDADNARVVLLRKPAESGTPPNEFHIHQLVVNGFNFDRAATFHALLSNPKPRGEIHCDGRFGPWNAEDPSRTPVYGNYTFRDADLGTLKGLKGILSSAGSFGGPLDYLDVKGVTDTPDFALRTSGHPMKLHTDFAAVVDGTNGNTVLTNVTAQFLHTIVATHGVVVDVDPQVKGRTIVLDASSDHARVEDLLVLAVKSDRPIMIGSARFKTHIVIPEKEQDLVDRLQLDGQFALDDVRFTNPTTQGRVDTLSQKGQGRPEEVEGADAVSNFQGRFTLSQAEVRFSSLEFKVEGASVSLGGAYNLDNGQLDFRGELQMQAKLSQTTTGWKSIMLKPFDRLFEGHNGGARIPIKITGTRENPSFATDFHDKGNPRHNDSPPRN